MPAVLKNVLDEYVDIYQEKFRLYNLQIVLLTNRKEIIKCFSDFVSWKRLKVFKQKRGLSFYFLHRKPDKYIAQLSRQYQLLKREENIEYYRHKRFKSRFMMIISNQIFVFLNTNLGRIVVFTEIQKIWSSDFLNYLVILPVLKMMLSIHDIHSLHASCAGYAGRTVLFPAKRSSGKTTTILNLVKNGFSFMGDDTVFYYKRSKKIRILAFPRQINITMHSTKFFPEYKRYFKDIKHLSSKKYKVRLPVEKVLKGSKITRESIPSHIMIPRLRTGRKKTEVIPVSVKQAFLELFPQGIYLFDKHITSSQLEMLEQMCSHTSNFIINIGSDFEALPDIIKSCLCNA